jgi:hypothetical protein
LNGYGVKTLRTFACGGFKRFEGNFQFYLFLTRPEEPANNHLFLLAQLLFVEFIKQVIFHSRQGSYPSYSNEKVFEKI